MTAPFGRRPCEVTENRASGGYRVFSLLDPEGPEPLPGQFYMLAAEQHWEERGQRPFLPRAFSVADTDPASGGRRLDFLIEGVGPGTDRLCALEPGERVWVNGPLGNSFSLPNELSPGAAGAILVGGGIGIAPLPYLAEALEQPPAVLGFRSAHHAEAAALLPHAEVVVDPVLVTDALPAGRDVLACGPEPMLAAVRALAPAAQLAWEAPMACGYGACYGCVVEVEGELKRLCVEGPVLCFS